MTAPRHIIASVPLARLQAAMDSCAVCACGTTALHGEPERVVEEITHGCLACHRAPLGVVPPECCQECGEPFNNANSPTSGKCLACSADDYYDDAEDYAMAEREQLRDWEDSR